MTYRIFSGYSTDILGGTINGSVASSSFATDYSLTGRFFTGFSASIDFNSYSDALVAIKTSIDSIITPNTISLKYDVQTDKIILSSSIPCYLSFGDSAQKILGFLPSYPGSTQYITSSFKPWFLWESTNDNRSDDTDVYEMEQTFTERVADSGRTYSVGNDKTANYRDWSFSLEPKENLFNNKAASTRNFTYDLFLKNLRKGPYPFVVFDASGSNQTATGFDYSTRDGTYEMRAEATAFKPKQIFEDYFDYWNIDLKTRLLSRPNQTDTFDILPVTSSATITTASIPTSNMILWLDANSCGEFGLDSDNEIVITNLTDQSPYKSVSNRIASSVINFATSSVFNVPVYSLTKSIGYISEDYSPTGSTTLPNPINGLTIFTVHRNIPYVYDSNSYFSVMELEDRGTGFYIKTGFQTISGSSNKKMSYILNDTGATLWVTSSGLSSSSSYISIAQYNYSTPGSASIWINGSGSTNYFLQDTLMPLFCSTSGSSFDWALGITTPDTSSHWNPKALFPEMIVYGSVLNTGSINTVLSVLSSKYNISTSYF